MENITVVIGKTIEKRNNSHLRNVYQNYNGSPDISSEVTKLRQQARESFFNRARSVEILQVEGFDVSTQTMSEISDKSEKNAVLGNFNTQATPIKLPAWVNREGEKKNCLDLTSYPVELRKLMDEAADSVTEKSRIFHNVLINRNIFHEALKTKEHSFD